MRTQDKARYDAHRVCPAGDRPSQSIPGRGDGANGDRQRPRATLHTCEQCDICLRATPYNRWRRRRPGFCTSYVVCPPPTGPGTPQNIPPSTLWSKSQQSACQRRAAAISPLERFARQSPINAESFASDGPPSISESWQEPTSGLLALGGGGAFSRRCSPPAKACARYQRKLPRGCLPAATPRTEPMSSGLRATDGAWRQHGCVAPSNKIFPRWPFVENATVLKCDGYAYRLLAPCSME